MPVVAVFGSSTLTPDDPGYAEARRLGQLLGEGSATVVTGGYGGAMQAVSEGAASAGAHVIGVTAPTVFPGRSGINPHVDEEIPARTIAERIHRIVDMADAWIALPGSIGTLTELMVAWNTAFVAPFSGTTPPPLVVVGQGWRRFIDLLTNEYRCDPSFVTLIDTAEEAVIRVRAHLGISGPSAPGG